jgi:hypothetical protein
LENKPGLFAEANAFGSFLEKNEMNPEVLEGLGSREGYRY